MAVGEERGWVGALRWLRRNASAVLAGAAAVVAILGFLVVLYRWAHPHARIAPLETPRFVVTPPPTLDWPTPSEPLKAESESWTTRPVTFEAGADIHQPVCYLRLENPYEDTVLVDKVWLELRDSGAAFEFTDFPGYGAPYYPGYWGWGYYWGYGTGRYPDYWDWYCKATPVSIYTYTVSVKPDTPVVLITDDDYECNESVLDYRVFLESDPPGHQYTARVGMNWRHISVTETQTLYSDYFVVVAPRQLSLTVLMGLSSSADYAPSSDGQVAAFLLGVLPLEDRRPGLHLYPVPQQARFLLSEGTREWVEDLSLPKGVDIRYWAEPPFPWISFVILDKDKLVVNSWLGHAQLIRNRDTVAIYTRAFDDAWGRANP